MADDACWEHAAALRRSTGRRLFAVLIAIDIFYCTNLWRAETLLTLPIFSCRRNICLILLLAYRMNMLMPRLDFIFSGMFGMMKATASHGDIYGHRGLIDAATAQTRSIFLRYAGSATCLDIYLYWWHDITQPKCSWCCHRKETLIYFGDWNIWVFTSRYFADCTTPISRASAFSLISRYIDDCGKSIDICYAPAYAGQRDIRTEKHIL